MGHTKLIRDLFSKGPLRWVRDGLLLTGRKLDPSLTVLIPTLSNTAIEKYVDSGELNVDRIFSICRRRLWNDADWRYGPKRIFEVAREAFDAFKEFTSVHNKTYLDLGCGSNHPYGISTIMFLNGASATISLDIGPTDNRRAAEALFDLLAACATNPNAWNWSGGGREKFLDLIYKFNLPALAAGDLFEGLANAPLAYKVCDILENDIRHNSVDLMSSRAVLEHFMDFDHQIMRLMKMMSPGGIAYHHIDLTDHRHYEDPRRYHYWSFLAEDEEWSDGLCNRLRASEIHRCFVAASFEILKWDVVHHEMPRGFRSKLKGRFSRMSNEELNITRVCCVLRKPLTS